MTTANDSQVCVHWWRISTPSGPWCFGVCKKCGEERQFPTTPESLDYAPTPIGPRKPKSRPISRPVAKFEPANVYPIRGARL